MAGARSPGRRIFRGAPPRRDGGGPGPPPPGRPPRPPPRVGWGRPPPPPGAGGEASALGGQAARRVRASRTGIGPVWHALAEGRVGAAVFVGKFWKRGVCDNLHETDAVGRPMARGGLSDEALANVALATLG